MQDIQATYVANFHYQAQHLQIGLTDDLLNLLIEVCSIYVPVIILHFVKSFLKSATVESREDHSEWVCPISRVQYLNNTMLISQKPLPLIYSSKTCLQFV